MVKKIFWEERDHVLAWLSNTYVQLSFVYMSVY